MTEENGPAFLRGYVPATDKPQAIAPIKYYEIGNSSFEMLVPPKPGRKPNNGPSLPLAALHVGQSFNVPLNRSQTSLLDVMRKAQSKGAKFRLIIHETHYEIGRVA